MQRQTMEIAREPVSNCSMRISTNPLSETVLSAEALERDLALMQSERTGLRILLEGIPDREREMLDRDATDDEFLKIDLERRRAHRRIGRLDELERACIEALQAKKDEETTRRWLEYVDRYEAIAESLAASGRELLERGGELLALCNEAARAGFSRYGGAAHLPFEPLRHNQAQLDAFVDLVPSLRATSLVQRREVSFTVRFLEWTPHRNTAYLRGQEAGFSADQAWALVRAEKAEWVDLTRIPPPPPVPPKSKRQREGHAQ